ncbi:MAG: integrase core domain-containing protein [Chloroflexi bacterium]|nr:integrase core domain-containing protein [Chloroflexota bacterium]
MGNHVQISEPAFEWRLVKAWGKWLSWAHRVAESKVLIAQWRKEYNQVRPHSAKDCRPPAPEAEMRVTLTL